MDKSKPLLLSRRFAPLFWCQFFAAFGDNFFKTALSFLVLFHIEGSTGESLTTFAAAIFIAPYFFLSALGGEIADRYDKALVAQRVKFVEIGVAMIAVAGFTFHLIPVLFVALFLFGVLGALFGPIKYGILPDHLARSELPAGNALVEGATFMAILFGTIVGALAAKGGGDPGLVRRSDDRNFDDVLDREPADPAHRRSRARAENLAQYFRLDLGTDLASARRQALVVGRARHELVLACRRRDYHAGAAARENGSGRQRGSRSRRIKRLSRLRSQSDRGLRLGLRAGALCCCRR